MIDVSYMRLESSPNIPPANILFHRQVYSGPLPRRLVAQAASATATSASKPTMAAFSARVAYKMPSYN